MPSESRLLSTSLAVAAYFAVAGLLIHVVTNGGYGYFRDELYMLDCGEHLAWGYVDHAPLIGLIAKLSRTLFGESLDGLRLLPALAGALTILLTGLIARELGAGRWGVALASLCSLVAPPYLIFGTLLTMNVFEPLFWMGCVYVLVLAIKRDDPKLLLWFGVLAGVGLENKHSMLFFGFALVAGLLLTSERRLLASRWMWIAGAIALALFLPNLIWQIQHQWPTLEDLANVRRTHKNIELTPLAYVGQQVLMMLPASALVWGAGLWFLLFHREAKRYRALGWAFLVVLGVMLVLHGKNYYLAPAYPMLFAAGGVFWERLTARLWLRIALPAVVAVMGALAAPMALPILSPENLVRYEEALGAQPPKTEVGHVGRLPQHFGDMFGWEDMVRTVAGVYHRLPPEERAKAAILTGNFGEAGAIDLFGPRYGLPKAISGHQTYYLWGPRQYTGEVVILLQWPRRAAERHFTSVEDGPFVGHPWGMAEENYTILIGRGMKQPLAQFWPRLKHWN
jgi:hypothetical protein